MPDLTQLQTTLEWTGCLMGLAGAAVLASKKPWAAWGWALFLVSNGFLVAYGIVAGASGITTMQVGYTITSSFGVWNWLIKKEPT